MRIHFHSHARTICSFHLFEWRRIGKDESHTRQWETETKIIKLKEHRGNN